MNKRTEQVIVFFLLSACGTYLAFRAWGVSAALFVLNCYAVVILLLNMREAK